MVVTLSLRVLDDSRLLEQVCRRMRTDQSATTRELDVKMLAKAGRVVVARRLRVAKSLHHRVGLHQLVSDRWLSFAAGGAPRGRTHPQPHHAREADLHCLGLTGATLSRDDDALVHVGVRLQAVVRGVPALTPSPHTDTMAGQTHRGRVWV